MIRTILFLMLSTWLSAAGAMETTLERQWLLRIYQQLEALNPLLEAAQQAQAPKTHPQFHYREYQDHTGQSRPGLRDDLDAIKTGILAYLHDQRTAPRHLPPIAGDYR